MHLARIPASQIDPAQSRGKTVMEDDLSETAALGCLRIIQTPFDPGPAHIDCSCWQKGRSTRSYSHSILPISLIPLYRLHIPKLPGCFFQLPDVFFLTQGLLVFPAADFQLGVFSLGMIISFLFANLAGMG